MRTETDLLGPKEISDEVYWGIHTQRALENFQVTGQRVADSLVRAVVQVKKAAGDANKELGFLDHARADAVLKACDEILSGRLADQFPLDPLQGGAGTSLNMNVNEVVANRALEILGHSRGDYAVIHPVEHVNLHQSTNDVFPTAVKIAVITQLRQFSARVEALQNALQRKEKELADCVSIGRTEMQEAVPMTLGAQFSAFSEAAARDRWRIFKCEERLRQVNIGGTAVGTGLCAPREYIFLVIEKLRAGTGLNLCRGENVVDQTANTDCFVEVSGILKAHACNLIKIANDLRLLNLLKDIRLPSVQAGSSIMPGKVNPVICESVIQSAVLAQACDMMVTESVSRSTLQINEFLPLLSWALLRMIAVLDAADEILTRHVEAITAWPQDNGRCPDSVSVMTAFVPVAGYKKVEDAVRRFEAQTEQTLREFLEEEFGAACVDQALSPESLTALGFVSGSRRRQEDV